MSRLLVAVALFVVLSAPAWLCAARDVVPEDIRSQDDMPQVLTNERLARMDWLDRAVVMRFKFERWRLDRADDLLHWVSLNDCQAAERYRDQHAWPGIARFFAQNSDRILDSLDARFVNTLDMDLGPWDVLRPGFPVKYFDARYVGSGSQARYEPDRIGAFVVTNGKYAAGCSSTVPRYFVSPIFVRLDRTLPGELLVTGDVARSFIATDPELRRVKARMVVRMVGSSSQQRGWSSDLAGHVDFAVATASLADGSGATRELALGDLVPAAPPQNRADLEGRDEGVAWSLAIGRRID